jgi:bifunctional enzyme CysN/CysC
LLDSSARAWRNGHRGAVIWLTGLPASGKSTLAMQLERRLFELGFNAYVLDGDNVRAGLSNDLGFSADDRRENVRRVGEVAALFADAGTIAIAAFISPYRSDRERARYAAGPIFHEVFVKADPALCEARDPKGHYRRARAGTLENFTGISGDYEPPLQPELVLDTGELSVSDATERLLRYVENAVSLQHRG